MAVELKYLTRDWIDEVDYARSWWLPVAFRSH
jgi:hypothetical protein